MIYEETYNYLLKNVSSTEFDLCLYALLKIDWDGNVHANVNEFARNIGTTEKYVREMIKKFTTGRKGRFAFVKSKDANALFRFNLGKTSLDFSRTTDRYCKKYDFFYNNNFKSLPINAKRLLLMGAFRMSILKSERVAIPVEEVVPNFKNNVSLPFTKSRLKKAIDTIDKVKLKGVKYVTIASNIYTQKEEVIYIFEENTLNSFKENHAERFALRKKLYESGYTKFLSEEYCIEIERVGKFLYRSLMKVEKETAKNNGSHGDKEGIREVARDIYNEAIEKLAVALSSKEEELNEPKKVSAYFSSISYGIAVEKMAFYLHKAESIYSLLEKEYIHLDAERKMVADRGITNYVPGYLHVSESLQPIKEKAKPFMFMYNVLKNWGEDWVISRVKGVMKDSNVLSSDDNYEEVGKKRGWATNENGEFTKEQALEAANKVKELAVERIKESMGVFEKLRNKAINHQIHSKLLNETKEKLNNYIDITFGLTKQKWSTDSPFKPNYENYGF